MASLWLLSCVGLGLALALGGRRGATAASAARPRDEPARDWLLYGERPAGPGAGRLLLLDDVLSAALGGPRRRQPAARTPRPLYGEGAEEEGEEEPPGAPAPVYGTELKPPGKRSGARERPRPQGSARATLGAAGAGMASQFMLRSARGNRQYDVPQIGLSTMPAVGRRYGEVCVSGGRPHGPVSMHRRPRAVRRLHRLPGRRGRGQAGVHVLQNHKSAPRRTGGRSAAVGERPLICSSSPRHTLTLLIHIHAPTTTRIYAAIRTPTYARVPEYSSEERRRRRRSGGGGREEDYMTPTATFTRCPTVHNAINSALS